MQETIYFSNKKSIRWINNVLIAIIGISLPIGEGISVITGVDYSKLFPVAIISLTLYTIFFSNFRFSLYPKYLNYFVLFVFLHTVFTYLVFFPYDLFKPVSLDGGTMALSLVRFFLFITFFYIISHHIIDLSKFKIFIIFYSLGFSVAFILGAQYIALSTYSFMRLSGGFLNPNSFGASSLMVIYLNTFLLVQSKNRILVKLFSVCFILLGLVGVVLSQSRGVILALFVSFGYFFLKQKKNQNKIKILVVAGILLVVGFSFVPESIVDDVEKRFSISDRVSANEESRMNIWSDYLHELPSYFLTGVGRGRVTEITKSTFTSRKLFVTHNRYLNTLGEFGVVGFVLLLLFLREMYKNLTKRSNLKNQSFIPNLVIVSFFLAWLIQIFFGDYTNSRDFWLFVGIIVAFGHINVNCGIHYRPVE